MYSRRLARACSGTRCEALNPPAVPSGFIRVQNGSSGAGGRLGGGGQALAVAGVLFLAVRFLLPDACKLSSILVMSASLRPGTRRWVFGSSGFVFTVLGKPSVAGSIVVSGNMILPSISQRPSPSTRTLSQP